MPNRQYVEPVDKQIEVSEFKNWEQSNNFKVLKIPLNVNDDEFGIHSNRPYELPDNQFVEEPVFGA